MDTVVESSAAPNGGSSSPFGLHRTRGRERRIRRGLGLLAVLLTGMGLASCSDSPTDEGEPEADILLTSVSTDPTSVYLGESVEVTATVENRGAAAGEESLSLEVNGDVVETQTVSLQAADDGDNGSVAQSTATFTWSPEEAGDYELTVNGTAAGTVTAEEEPAPAPDLQVEHAQADPTTVQEGETVTVSATVENHGDAEGNKTLQLRVDGDAEDSQSVSVDPGETEDVSFSWSSDEPGDYDLAVNDEDAGTVTVEPEPASLEITAVGVDPDEPVETMQANAYAEVTNFGGASGALTVDFEVNGSEEGSETVQVDGGDTETATFSWTPDEVEEYELSFNGETLNVEVLAAVEVVDAWLEDESIHLPDEGHVDVEAVNRTDSNQDLEMVLEVFTWWSGQPIWGTYDDDTRSVSPGTADATIFTFDPDQVGEYPLRVNGVEVGILEVYGIEVTDAYLEYSQVPPGEEVDVGFDAENHSSEHEQEEVELQAYVPGPQGRARWVTVDSMDVSMNGGSSFQWGDAFTIELDEPGEYPIRIRDGAGTVDAGTLRVRASQ